MPRTIAANIPMTLVFDTDIGGAVGSLLTREILSDYDIVSIDEVQLGDLDFIDLGEMLEDVHAVPVVVKSLVFSTARERASGLMPGEVRPHADRGNGGGQPHSHGPGQPSDHDHSDGRVYDHSH